MNHQDCPGRKTRERRAIHVRLTQGELRTRDWYGLQRGPFAEWDDQIQMDHRVGGVQSHGGFVVREDARLHRSLMTGVQAAYYHHSYASASTCPTWNGGRKASSDGGVVFFVGRWASIFEAICVACILIIIESDYSQKYERSRGNHWYLYDATRRR